MKTSRWLLISVVLGLVGCPSSKTVKPAVAPVVNDSPTAKRPFLWRVEGKTGTSYLLGTMHVGVDARKAFSTSVWRAFDAAKTAVFEVSIKGLDSFGLGVQPEGQTLDKQMTPQQWTKLLETLKIDPEGSSASRLKGMRAWIVVAEIINSMAPPTPSIDTTLRNRAEKLGKTLVFLESIKVQAAILDKYANVEYLLAMVANLKVQRASIKEDVELYIGGDGAAFEKSAITDMEKHIGAAGMEQLLYGRNRSWMPALIKAIDGGNAFIAVGTAHLLGARSVIVKLRKHGYKVTRILEP